MLKPVCDFCSQDYFFFSRVFFFFFWRFDEKICNGVDKEIYDIERNHCIVKIGRISFSLKKAMIPLSIWFYDVINLSLPLFFCVVFFSLAPSLYNFLLHFSHLHLLPLVPCFIVMFCSIPSTRSYSIYIYM